MKRDAVIKKIKKQATVRGLTFGTVELTRHTAVQVDGVSRTLGRHSEINDLTAHKFWDQFADVLGGKGWWR